MRKNKKKSSVERYGWEGGKSRWEWRKERWRKDVGLMKELAGNEVNGEWYQNGVGGTKVMWRRDKRSGGSWDHSFFLLHSNQHEKDRSKGVRERSTWRRFVQYSSVVQARPQISKRYWGERRSEVSITAWNGIQSTRCKDIDVDMNMNMAKYMGWTTNQPTNQTSTHYFEWQ